MRFAWPWRHDQGRRHDPYWRSFIHTSPADPNNLIPHAFGQVTDIGTKNPARTEVHSPNVMASHVKELARFYGADRVGIVAREGELPFAIVCLVEADYDTRSARGIGGQTPALKGLFATFTLAAYIRELGYQAARANAGDHADRLSVAAGLDKLGRHSYVADVIYTDLPLEPDGRLLEDSP